MIDPTSPSPFFPLSSCEIEEDRSESLSETEKDESDSSSLRSFRSEREKETRKKAIKAIDEATTNLPYRITYTGKKRNVWTPEEDKLLIELVDKCKKKGYEKIPWSTFVPQFHDRFDRSEIFHHFYFINPEICKGKWSKRELTIFKRGLRKGYSDAKIAQLIKTRHRGQIRLKRQELDPDIKRGPFTESEDEKILKYYEKYKNSRGKWTKINNKLPRRRLLDSLSARAKQLVSTHSKKYTYWPDKHDQKLVRLFLKYYIYDNKWDKIVADFHDQYSFKHCINRLDQLKQKGKFAKQLAQYPHDITQVIKEIRKPKRVREKAVSSDKSTKSSPKKRQKVIQSEKATESTSKKRSKKADTPSRTEVAEAADNSVVSQRKNVVHLACRVQIEQYLAKQGKRLGRAIDDGDCFYDALLKGGLNSIINADNYKQLTVKDLRITLQEHFRTLDRKQLLEILKLHVASGHTVPLDEYLKSLSTTFAEYLSASEQGDSIPLPEWGDHRLEGYILANRLFPIHLIVHELGPYNADQLREKILAKQPLADEDFWRAKYAYGNPDNPIIEIALFPGHYDPVLKI